MTELTELRKVYSREGTIIELSLGAISQSSFLSDLFSKDDDQSDDDIPTIDLSYDVLLKVKEYCEHYVIEPMNYLPKKPTEVRIINVQEWYKEWVNELFEMNIPDPDDPEYMIEHYMWYELMIACNKLDLQQLFALLAVKFVIEKTNYFSHEVVRTEKLGQLRVDGTREPIPEMTEERSEELKKNLFGVGFEKYYADRVKMEEEEKAKEEERKKRL